MNPFSGDRTARARRHLVQALMGGVALIAAWIVVAATEDIPAVEEAIFRGINGLPNWIEIIGWPVMQFGALLAIPIVALAAWRFLGNRRLAIEVLAAGGSAWLAALIIKQIVGRERPGAVLTDVRLRPLWEGLGFPSGHAAVAAAMATVLAVWARGRWLLMIWAVPLLVGILRIYTGAHFPLDVVAGWGLGLLLGTGVGAIGRHLGSRLADR